MFITKKEKYNTVLVQTHSLEILSQAFMRFQEYYESPKFKDKIFTVGQLRQWYSETYGANTYQIDFSGFNFPSYILNPFKNGLFDPLTNLEKKILNLFRYRNDDFYIIGALDQDTIRHELSHALYYHKKEYAQKINNLLNKNKNKICKIKKYLKDNGYCDDVIYDEIQAYVTDDDNDFIKTNLDLKIINQIKTLYNNYV